MINKSDSPHPFFHARISHRKTINQYKPFSNQKITDWNFNTLFFISTILCRTSLISIVPPHPIACQSHLTFNNRPFHLIPYSPYPIPHPRHLSRRRTKDDDDAPKSSRQTSEALLAPPHPIPVPVHVPAPAPAPAAVGAERSMTRH